MILCVQNVHCGTVLCITFKNLNSIFFVAFGIMLLMFLVDDDGVICIKHFPFLLNGFQSPTASYNLRKHVVSPLLFIFLRTLKKRKTFSGRI